MRCWLSLCIFFLLIACSQKHPTLEPEWLNEIIENQDDFRRTGSILLCDYDGSVYYKISDYCMDCFQHWYRPNGEFVCSSGGLAGERRGNCSEVDDAMLRHAKVAADSKQDMASACDVIWKYEPE